jgi:hypothetical protein
VAEATAAPGAKRLGTGGDMSEASEVARQHYSGGGGLQDLYARLLQEIPDEVARQRAGEYVTGWLLISIESQGSADAGDVLRAIRRAGHIYRDGIWPGDEPEDN